MFRLAIIVTLLLCRSAGADVSKEKIDATVREAFPQRLAALAGDHRNLADNLPTRRAAWAMLSTTGGRATVFAAYSDDELGMVQVMDIGGTSRVVAVHESLLDAGPGEPQLELTDVDGDGTDEIFVEFPHVRRPFAQTYIFKFAAGQLALLSPLVCPKVDPGFETTALLVVNSIDLDGDKLLELVDRREQRIDGLSTAEEEALIERVRLWKLEGGKYQQTGEAVFFEHYVRDSGAPQSVPAEFYADAGRPISSLRTVCSRLRVFPAQSST